MTSQAEELKKFPPRILQTLKDMADRRSIGNRGPWEYGDGTPMQDDAEKFIEELRRLASEVESLKLDAARYRWLRLPDSVLPISTEQARNPELYDAAIDAKMAKEQPNG